MRQYFLFIVLLVISIQWSPSLKAQTVEHKIKLPGIDGASWKDVDGKPINAHGLGILFHDGIYYMFGEIKQGKTWLVQKQSWEAYRVPAGGVSCYSSKDLVKWKYRGVALSPSKGNPSHDLDTGKVIERPKVIYNRRTRKFVMWMHIDTNDYGYAQAGCAISDKPEGPYSYLGSVKPNGQMSRDLTVYKDSDERAYLVYASENNKIMQVCLLTDDYLHPTTTYSRITSAEDREAPAIFKFRNKYYLITSGCTGWSPNQATYATADSLLGSWDQKGNPCNGPDAATTFQSQSTFALPMQEKPGYFIFMADQWKKTDLPNSGYLWIPFQMKDSILSIKSPKNFTAQAGQ